jgi:hypothetical protein
MAVELRSTAGFAQEGVKALVYGQAGAGKTRLIQTLPTPVIISAEGGLLSLRNVDIPYIQVGSMAELQEVYAWLAGSDEARQFQSVALDSISEIAEVVLTVEKGSAKDPRQAYGAMADQMASLIRAFRDLPGHVYFSAKLEKVQDEMGRQLYGPSMPGNKVGQQLPYFFDEVLALRLERDAEGELVRALMCEGDGTWVAKDRSGRLGAWEAPDLEAIIAKISGGNPESKEVEEA